jgi:putative phosphoesterase
MAAADLIMHLGDFAAVELLHELEALGPPVAAVHGNVDAPELRARLPEARTIDAAGARIAMVHDAGPARGRLNRMRLRFPDVAAVVFGHSHIPLHEERDGFQLFNPGSPTDRRRQPRHTMGLARAQRGRVAFELLRLD